ncbi:hypothetical protein ACJJTC_009305 [Scirpophaga incertulas]
MARARHVAIVLTMTFVTTAASNEKFLKAFIQPHASFSISCQILEENVSLCGRSILMKGVVLRLRWVHKANFSKLSTRSKANWKCHACKAPSKTDDSTPVKPMLDGSPQRMPIQTDNLEEYFNKLESSLLLNLKLETALLIDNKLESALAPLKQEIYKFPDLLKCVEFMNEKFDEMHKEVCELRTKTSEIHLENTKLREEVKALSFRVSQIEQQARECNVDVQCVPEHSNENLVSVVVQLNKVVSYPLDENNILIGSRVSKASRDSTRPRSVIVKLSSPRIRDSFIAAYYKFNKANPLNRLSSAHLGMGGGDAVLQLKCEDLVVIGDFNLDKLDWHSRSLLILPRTHPLVLV